MTGGGNPNHDPKTGEFSSGPGGAAESRSKFHRAREWVRSVDAKRAVARVVNEENARAAVTFAIQNALFHMSHAEDPIADAYVEVQVHALADRLKISIPHARDTLIASVRAMRKVR